MKIALDIHKTVEQNASVYYEKGKKSKKKIAGILQAIKIYEEKLKNLESVVTLKKQQKKEILHRKKVWFEKFRWFITSTGFLVIGGRDSTTNEIIIKKHTEANDLVFHTDMAGSPFFVIKSKKIDSNKIEPIDEISIQETADATCTFSRAFKLNLTTQTVFYVKPEQVSKEANAGEYLTKGAFMIKGKTNYIDNKINLAIGVTKDYGIMSGPLEAVKKHCTKHVLLKQGEKKPSDIAKMIRKMLDYHDLDDIIRALPAGNLDLK